MSEASSYADQLTEADVHRLTQERKYDEIEAARVGGRLDRLLGVPAEEIELKARALSGQITEADAARLNRLGLHDLVVAAATENRITDEQGD